MVQPIAGYGNGRAFVKLIDYTTFFYHLTVTCIAFLPGEYTSTLHCAGQMANQ